MTDVESTKFGKITNVDVKLVQQKLMVFVVTAQPTQLLQMMDQNVFAIKIIFGIQIEELVIKLFVDKILIMNTSTVNMFANARYSAWVHRSNGCL